MSQLFIYLLVFEVFSLFITKLIHLSFNMFFQVIESALGALKHSNTDSFYRRLSWDVIRCFLVASLHVDDDMPSMHKLFSHSGLVL